jgi:hypothetical protein
MRSLLAIALIACGAPSPPATKPVDTYADPLAHCRLFTSVLERAGACAPVARHVAAHEDTRRWHDPAKLAAISHPTERALTTRRNGAYCAHMVEVAVKEPGAERCELVDAARIAEVDAFLDAYYAHRAVPRPTGDPAIDAHLQRLAAIRDEMCACKDTACAPPLDSRFDQEVISRPGNSSPELLASSLELLDDLTKCKSELRFASGR